MNNFQFYSPTEFVFGKNTENEAGHYEKSTEARMFCCILAVVPQLRADCSEESEHLSKPKAFHIQNLAEYSRIPAILLYTRESTSAARKI